jgi:hypothetical protein
MISVRPTITSSDGSTPTAVPAFLHHTARTTHDSRPPAIETAGVRPAALSMNKPASRMARSRARPQSAVAARGPAARNSNMARLARSTAPEPHLGSMTRPWRRQASGTPR